MERAQAPEGRSGAIVIVVVATLTILYFTLFPFDIVNRNASPAEVLGRFSLTTGPVWRLREMPANALLFLPLGAGLAGLIRGRGTPRPLLVIATCASTGCGLSLAIELVQSMWLLRRPAVDDVVANAIGAAFGAWLWTRRWAVAPRLRRHSPSQGRWRLAWMMLSFAPISLAMIVVVMARDETRLAEWDVQFPLVLGNEPDGSRPWTGTIARVSLADRRVTDEESRQLLAGRRMREIVGVSTLVDLDFVETSAIPAGWHFDGTAADPELLAGAGASLGPTQWLSTDDPVATITRRVDSTDSFTVAMDVTTGSLDQTGPARVLTISNGPFQRNLTIAQEGADLVVRARSGFTGENGVSPEYVIPAVFREAQPQRIVVRYDPSQLQVAIGDAFGSRTRTLGLFPATVPMVRWFTDDVTRLRVSAIGAVMRDVYLAALMCAPWMVGAAVIGGGWRSIAALTAAVGVVVSIVLVTCAGALPVEPSQLARLVGVTIALLVLAALSTLLPHGTGQPGQR